ncbi:MAG TPA: OsmC family protein [Solirubrobacterales bacterium]|nr:OsmC family protein [Solirubrobacterales bacterium]
MDLRETQAPLKQRYREDPDASRITLRASASETETPISCSVAVGQAVSEAQAHSGVGGAGTAACSGDMLLGALAACAQLTCQMVANSMGIEAKRIEVEVEGDHDPRGTLGVNKSVPAGFEAIRLSFDVEAPNATDEQIASLLEKTERYCTVLQTLRRPPPVEAGTT